MISNTSKYDYSSTRIHVEFTKKGERSLQRTNRKLKEKPIIPTIMIRDVAEFVEHHIEAGDPMIEEFTVRYDDGILLTAYLTQEGYYLITDVDVINPEPSCFPYYVWERIKVGCRWVLAQVFVGWCNVFSPLKLECRKCY